MVVGRLWACFDEEEELVHDIWCRPGNDQLEQIYKARRGKGYTALLQL